MIRTGAERRRPWRPAALRKLRQQKGAVALEFTFAGVLFFVLFFAIVEFGLMFWVNLTMQHAVREGARYAITGQNETFGPDGEKVHDRTLAVTRRIQDSSMGLYDRVVRNLRVSSPSGSSFSGYGAPDDIIVVSLDCSWPLLTPLVQPFFKDSGGEYKFTVSATMKNEAF